jgi:hypothetical protein
MSGQGHQIFADALAGAGLARLADRVRAPLRVAVSGRRGVGVSTVVAALSGAGFDVAHGVGADIDVYVVAEVLKPEDRAALAAAHRPAYVVFTKADLAGFGPGGPLSRARRQADRLTALTGVPAGPLVGLLAALDLGALAGDALAALGTLVSHPADLRSPDAFVAAPHPVGTQMRAHLIETLDLFGIAHAVMTLRGEPDAGAERLAAVLRRASGIEEVRRGIERAGAQVRYNRVAAVCDELEVRAITDATVARFLRCDDTVLVRMSAAVDVVEAAGLAVDRSDEPAAHLERARLWRRYAAGPVSPVHARCGVDISRGSLRLISPGGTA